MTVQKNDPITDYIERYYYNVPAKCFAIPYSILKITKNDMYVEIRLPNSVKATFCDFEVWECTCRPASARLISSVGKGAPMKRVVLFQADDIINAEIRGEAMRHRRNLLGLDQQANNEMTEGLNRTQWRSRNREPLTSNADRNKQREEPGEKRKSTHKRWNTALKTTISPP